MRIFTFYNTAEDAPASARAIARIWCDMPGKAGKTAPGWHSVIVTAATMDDARDNLQSWWDGEIAKARAKADGKAARAVKPTGAPSSAVEIWDDEAIG